MEARQVKSFAPKVAHAMGVYVYRLIDPRTDEAFYVGKGVGNRVFDHVNCAEQLLVSQQPDGEDTASLKLGRIREIMDAGFEVSHVIHRHGLTDEVAFEVEAALIDVYPELTNLQSGRASGVRAAMSVEELEALYALPVLGDCSDLKLVLINVNALDGDRGRASVYDQVRFAWKINVARAGGADLVLAVRRGVVIGVYTAVWKSATVENFPEFGLHLPERWGFVGEPASSHMWERLVGERGKRIVEETMLHVRNPIRYWRI